MLKFVSLALIVTFAAALAAGCGESERSSYERELAKVGATVEEALNALPQDDSKTIGPAELNVLADSLRESADQLVDLDPPTDVATAHGELERGLRGVATGFDSLAAQLQEASDDRDRAALFVEFESDPKVDKAFDDIIAAQEAFAAKSYRVFRAGDPAAQDAA